MIYKFLYFIEYIYTYIKMSRINFDNIYVYDQETIK